MDFTSVPFTCTRPADGGWSPDTSESVVDLPQPVGPTTATNSPGWTVMVRSRTAVCTEPDPLGNRLVAPVSSISGGTMGSDSFVTWCLSRWKAR